MDSISMGQQTASGLVNKLRRSFTSECSKLVTNTENLPALKENKRQTNRFIGDGSDGREKKEKKERGGKDGTQRGEEESQMKRQQSKRSADTQTDLQGN